MLTLSPVKAFSDNYIWVLHNQNAAIAIDPGDAGPLQDFLDAQGIALQAVLITHKHSDHIGGLDTLLRRQPALAVFGPSTLAQATRRVSAGARIDLLGLEFEVFEVPGHTLDHLAYHAAPWLFCGDTLFGAGCGRLFEGTPAQMRVSLGRLASLPPTTLICAAHEYTLSNLHFARAVENANPEITRRLIADQGKRDQDLPTLPSTLALELATNPFLRTACDSVKKAVEIYCARQITDADEVFAELRSWKNGFRADSANK